MDLNSPNIRQNYLILYYTSRSLDYSDYSEWYRPIFWQFLIPKKVIWKNHLLGGPVIDWFEVWTHFFDSFCNFGFKNGGSAPRRQHLMISRPSGGSVWSLRKNNKLLQHQGVLMNALLEIFWVHCGWQTPGGIDFLTSRSSRDILYVTRWLFFFFAWDSTLFSQADITLWLSCVNYVFWVVEIFLISNRGF